MPDELQRIAWDVIFVDSLIENTYHNVFELESKPGLKVDVGQPVLLQVVDPSESSIYNIGMGVVSSIKFCQVHDLEPLDLSRQKGSYRTRKGAANRLRLVTKEDVNMLSVLRVITIRKNDHDLRTLNTYMKKQTLPQTCSGSAPSSRAA